MLVSDFRTARLMDLLRLETTGVAKSCPRFYARGVKFDAKQWQWVYLSS